MTTTVPRPTVRRPATKRPAGHRGVLGRKPAPAAPRRVSGPLKARPRPAQEPRHRLYGARAAAFVRSLPDHSLLDRLVRGRAWIPLLGVLLAGIVAMQVEVLKLGASIGRAIETSSALQSRNDLLRASVASLGDDQRIERLAAGMGMVMPVPTTVGFIDVRRGDLSRAAANIAAPDPATFSAALTALTASATPPGASSTGSSTTTQTAPGTGAPAVATPTGTSSTQTGTSGTQTGGTTSGTTTTPTSTGQTQSSGTGAATSTQSTGTTSTQTGASPTQPVAPASGSSQSGGASPAGG